MYPFFIEEFLLNFVAAATHVSLRRHNKDANERGGVVGEFVPVDPSLTFYY
jgi:hypothetical protein